MIRTDRPHVGVAALTHPGETGKNNEDRYGVTSFELDAEAVPSVLAVVTDGIGGHQAGEIASQLALDAFVESISASSGTSPVDHMHSAVLRAAQAIANAVEQNPSQEGMGSTLSAAWIVGWRLYTVSVGDSRMYLLRGGQLRQLTIDHTWVQEAIDHHVITAAEARGHPNSHVLRRHLGSRQEPVPDFRLRLSPDEADAQSEANQGLQLLAGDRLLLCTDGLTDLVEDSELRSTLSRLAPQEAVNALVSLARRRGGFDNITAVLLVVPGAAVPAAPSERTSSRRRWRLLLSAGLASLILILLVLAALAAGWWFGIGPWSRAAMTPSPVATLAPPVGPNQGPTLPPPQTATPLPPPTAVPGTVIRETFTAIPLASVTLSP